MTLREKILVHLCDLRGVMALHKDDEEMSALFSHEIMSVLDYLLKTGLFEKISDEEER